MTISIGSSIANYLYTTGSSSSNTDITLSRSKVTDSNSSITVDASSLSTTSTSTTLIQRSTTSPVPTNTQLANYRRGLDDTGHGLVYPKNLGGSASELDIKTLLIYAKVKTLS